MRPRLVYALLVLFLPAILFSCKKDHQSAPIPVPPAAAPSTVYVLGVQNDSILYWKNGAANNIFSESGVNFNFGTSSLTAAGNNVYIAGYEPTATRQLFPLQPVFWLNGAAMDLPDSTGSIGNGTANAVAVSNGNVYVAGIREYNSQQAQVPYSGENADYPITGGVSTLWKNGSPVSLANFGSVGMVDSGKFANRFFSDYVEAIYVSDSNVYVAGGSFYSVAHARYWKNGDPVDLTGQLNYTTSDGSAGFPMTTSIYAVGNDVYVGGFQSTSFAVPIALYWKNAIPVFLSTNSVQGSVANSVFVTAGTGGIVYVAGWSNINGYSRATLWKNGIPIELTGSDTSSVATSVCVNGKDIYVAGYFWQAPNNYKAAYWKDGNLVPLTDGHSKAIAYSISVQ